MTDNLVLETKTITKLTRVSLRGSTRTLVTFAPTTSGQVAVSSYAPGGGAMSSFSKSEIKALAESLLKLVEDLPDDKEESDPAFSGWA